MITLKRINNIIFLLIGISSLSCKQQITNKKELFIKTLYENPCNVNSTCNGKIKTDLILDTIQLNEKNTRSTTLFLGQFKKQYSISDLEKMHTKLDTFFSPNKNKNDTIYFSYKFNKIGEYYLEGYIEDLVLLKNYYPNGKARIITKQIKISEKVKVIEK